MSLRTFSRALCKIKKEVSYQKRIKNVKVGLSPPKKICVVCVIGNPLKIMKNVFYFILKTLFVLKISMFLSRCFGHVAKTA